uniref:Claudin-4 n=1 Tax=Dicentrarchus labrax TaxID=13489 RepID=A0A8P4JXB8_DICLA
MILCWLYPRTFSLPELLWSLPSSLLSLGSSWALQEASAPTLWRIQLPKQRWPSLLELSSFVPVFSSSSPGQMQCKIYDSLLALPQDIQAARALVVIAIIVAVFGVVLSIVGGKCTNFVEDPSAKAKVTIAAGIVFICAGVLILIPVCWSANSIIRDFYNPLLISAQRRELGAALYIGWGTAGLLILGGALLCSSCPPKESPEYPVKKPVPRSTATSRGYV